MATLDQRISSAERQLPDIKKRIAHIERERIGTQDVAAAFRDFDNVWNAPSSRE